MSPQITVNEKKKADDLGVSQKEIRFPRGPRILTPSKSFIAPRNSKQYDRKKISEMTINEVTRRFDNKTIENLYDNNRNILKTIKRRYVEDKINLFIPHLRLSTKLSNTQLNSFSQFLYVASESFIVLPTIDFSFFKVWRNEKKKSKIFDQNGISIYIEMIKNIVSEINSVGNGKPFIGIIPLIPFPYMEELFKYYQNEGINSFLIDAGTKDILGGSLYEFRTILSEINRNIVELPEAFIYASNLGYGLFKKKWTLADDFLSLFAYVDILGGTFKARGFNVETSKTYVPRAKVFSREDYVYNLSSYKIAEENLHIENLNRIKLHEYNEDEQILETKNLQNIIGEESMVKFLLNKDKISEDKIKYNRLMELTNLES